LPALVGAVALLGPVAAQDPAQAPAIAPTIAPAKPVLEVLASSSLWQEKAQEVHGIYRIERLVIDGKAQPSKLTLSKDFKTKAGPDLKLVLSPLTYDKVKGKTALQGTVVLGSLASNKGASSYAIPKGVELNKFKSVLIHCEEYSKLWGGVSLPK
jgi:Electron transfer DM13